MADLYQFSQSSLQLLENCIKAAEAANRPGLKWIELFKPDTKENNNSFNDDEDTVILSVKSPDHSVEDAEETKQIDEKKPDLNLEAVERIGAILNAAPNKLECLIQQCNYEALLPDLAKNLAFHCVQNICEEILISEIKNERIVFNFFQAFILQDTSNSLNLLVRGYKVYPDTVLGVIESVFTNTDVPTKLLEEFFIAADNEARSKFLQTISSLELPLEVFKHNLNTISCLYKSSQKTAEVNSFVLKGLTQCAQLCQEDKDYGRFLLAFFQGVSESNAQISRQCLEQLLDSHKTPFKRPCQAILDKRN